MLAKDYNNNLATKTFSRYGVSTGDEPPMFAMQEGEMRPIKKSKSFGRFRAQLIYNGQKVHHQDGFWGVTIFSSV
jgi:hypothetical protein